MTKLFIVLALAVGLGLGFFIGQTGVLLSPEIGSNEEIKQAPDLKVETNEEQKESETKTQEVVKTENQAKDSVVANEPNIYTSKLFSLRYPVGWRQTNSEGIADLLVKGSVDALPDPYGIYFISPDASYVNQKDGEITKGNVLSVYYGFAPTQGHSSYDLTVMRSTDAKYKNANRYEIIVVDGHKIVITNDIGSVDFDEEPYSPHSITAYTVDDEFEYSFVFDTPNKNDPKEWEKFKSILQTVRFK